MDNREPVWTPHAFRWQNNYCLLWLFLWKQIAHGNFVVYFFFFQYPFERGWHFLLLRINAGYCAKSDTRLASCRFRSRHRRAKHRLTIFTFCSLKTKEIKVISWRLCLIQCYICNARSSLSDLLFITDIPCSSPRFFLQSPGFLCSFVVCLSWPRCDRSFCGCSEFLCWQTGQGEGAGVKHSNVCSQSPAQLYLVFLGVWWNNFSLRPVNNCKQISLCNHNNYGTEIREGWEWWSKELMLVSSF